MESSNITIVINVYETLAIIASVGVLLWRGSAWMNTVNRRFDRLEKDHEKVEEKLDSIDYRLDKNGERLAGLEAVAGKK